nr:reverse transcriptase domain-containing protein [Tanacetum cinerariifolium]
MKELLEALLTVTASVNGKTLIAYLAASKESISAVLLAERDKKQVPMYFVSRTLHGAEPEYPELEKLILALVYAARNLRRYFQAHPNQATYQRLIDKVFSCQVRRNMKVNADEMVIKSDSKEEMIADIKRLSKDFEKMAQWTTKADEAFRRMKELLEALLTVTASVNGKTLIAYLAASKESISAVLLAERDKKQVPMYFVSRTLHGAEPEYPELEKLILALVYAARNLRRYFQAHPNQVLSDKPIKQILARLEKSRRIARWAIEVGEHEIKFKGRNLIKGQILADFLAKTPPRKIERLKMEKPIEKNRECMEVIHRRSLKLRWLWGRIDAGQPRRKRIRLCLKV